LEFGIIKSIYFNQTHACIFASTAKIYHKSKVENRQISKACLFRFFLKKHSTEVHQIEFVPDS